MRAAVRENGDFITFVDYVKTNKHMFELFSPSGSHTILVYRSYTDTKHRAASLRQQSFLFYIPFVYHAHELENLLHAVRDQVFDKKVESWSKA